MSQNLGVVFFFFFKLFFSQQELHFYVYTGRMNTSYYLKFQLIVLMTKYLFISISPRMLQSNLYISVLNSVIEEATY